MSEFTCENGHLMQGTKSKCYECGAKVGYMDGVDDYGKTYEQNRAAKQAEYVQQITIDMLISRIENAIEQISRNQSLPALNTLKGALLEISKISDKK